MVNMGRLEGLRPEQTLSVSKVIMKMRLMRILLLIKCALEKQPYQIR
jgi:hypothetical protein